MSRLMRGAGLVITAGLIGLTGCGTTQAGRTGRGEIARANQQHTGTADHGTVIITLGQARRHAECPRLLTVRQLSDRGQGGRAYRL